MAQEDTSVLEKELRQYFNDRATRVLREQQVDVSNSYRKLGGIRRDWYLEYKNNALSYEQDMDIVYNVKVDWVSL